MKSQTSLPAHIAFIMDGNRRWAKAFGKIASFGHRKGADKAEEIIELSVGAGIEHITLWALSTENWKKRSADERSAIFKIIEEIPKRAEKFRAHDVSIDFIGSRIGLPEDVLANMTAIEKDLKNEEAKHKVHIGINYGGREELMHAFSNLQESGTTITEEHISAELYTAGMPDVDLVIRPGGMRRLSGFMPWQSVYAELYFTDTNWPAFSAKEFQKALGFFADTKRNFGK